MLNFIIFNDQKLLLLVLISFNIKVLRISVPIVTPISRGKPTMLDTVRDNGSQCVIRLLYDLFLIFETNTYS